MRDKDRQSPESNGRPSLTREAMVALLFVKIGSPCLFWISTLPGRTPHPTPCSLGSFTSWPTQISKVCWITTVLWNCNSAFCCVFFVMCSSSYSLTCQWLVEWFYPIALVRLFHSYQSDVSRRSTGCWQRGIMPVTMTDATCLTCRWILWIFSTLCGLVSCFLNFFRNQTCQNLHDRVLNSVYRTCLLWLSSCKAWITTSSQVWLKTHFFLFFFLTTGCDPWSPKGSQHRPSQCLPLYNKWHTAHGILLAQGKTVTKPLECSLKMSGFWPSCFA